MLRRKPTGLDNAFFNQEKSMSGASEMTTKASRERPDGFLSLLRAVALTAVVIGAVGSVALMFWVGHRNPSRVLLFLFLVWVLAPFVALLLADMISKRWSFITRAALYIVMLILTLGSLACYGDVVLRPRPQPAFRFLVVPPASWMIMTIVVATAALISRRISRRGLGV
jgi:hypothetical protein